LLRLLEAGTTAVRVGPGELRKESLEASVAGTKSASSSLNVPFAPRERGIV
jgi:hypothetical protein